MFGSIYGPGVLNDTIVPGYGVTKFPVNLNTFWSLPNGTTRNFGDATQYVTYPVGRPDWMYQLAQNFTDSNHTSQWNPMLIGMNLMNNMGTNPYMSQMGQATAYEWGKNLRIEQEIQSAIQGIAGALGSMESLLSNLVKSDKLTNAQKATLKGLLEEVKALKSKIEAQLKAKHPTQEEVIEMQKEVQDLQKKVSDAADKIGADVNEGGNSSESSSSSNSSSSSSNENSGDLSGTEYENIDPETGKPNSLTTPSVSEVDQFCATIFRAVDGCGTDNETLAAAIEGLNANNIVEIVKAWEENYGQHTETGNDGFFARIFDDIDDGDQKKYVPIMLKALTDRAEALGIYDQIRDQVAIVNKELSYEVKWYKFNWAGGQDDHKMANALMAIYNKIVEKEKANKEGAKTAVEGRKNENNKKVEERKQEVETEKKNEIANKLKDALKLDEVPALSSALKINTDDNGEFTGYSIELDTPNGKVNVKGDTYQELALAIERNNLKVEDVLVRKTNA